MIEKAKPLWIVHLIDRNVNEAMQERVKIRQVVIGHKHLFQFS